MIAIHFATLRVLRYSNDITIRKTESKTESKAESKAESKTESKTKSKEESKKSICKVANVSANQRLGGNYVTFYCLQGYLHGNNNNNNLI